MATDISELTEESTHEEIQGMVDDIVKSRNSDEKSDSQKIAEERDEPTTTEPTAEPGTEENTASDGDDTSDTDGQAWFDDDLKAEVAARGIDEKDLSDFTSREEVDRAMRFFDKSTLDAGRKAKAESAEEKPETEPKSEPKGGQYEIGLNADLFDEELVNEFTSLRDHYESRIAALESHFRDAETQANEQRFDNIVDSLGHKDLFGKSGSESETEHQRRLDLFEAVDALQIGKRAQGRPADLNEALVQLASRMVFADELGKKDLKNRTRKLAHQADGRMGGSVTKAHNSTEPIKDKMRRLYKELDDAG